MGNCIGNNSQSKLGTNFNWVFVTELRLPSVKGELEVNNIIVGIFILKSLLYLKHLTNSTEL
jgi:hypothetical protein